MARRRKAEEAEEWVPPPFDEVEFMRQEIAGTKASVAAVLYAIGVAAVSFALTLARLPIVAFFAGIGMIVLLTRVLPLIGIDTAKFKRRDWLGHGSIVFFSWLAFWILLLNAPFGDVTRPDITNAMVASAADSAAVGLTCKNLRPGDNGALEPRGNSTLYLTFRATDNVAVGSVDASIGGASVTLRSAEATTDRCRRDGATYPAGTWEAFVPIPTAGAVALTVHVTDAAGNAHRVTFAFSVS